MAELFPYTVRLDSLEIRLATISSNLGLRVQDFIPSRGDGNEALDQGQQPRKFQLSIPLTGSYPDVAAKWQEYAALGDKPGNRVFVHPFLGRFVVKLGDLNFEDGPDSHIVSMSLTVVKPFTQTAITTEAVTQQEVDVEILALADILGEGTPDLGTFDPEFVGEPPDLGEFPPVDVQNMADTTGSWTSETTPDAMNRDIEGFISETDVVEAFVSGQNTTRAYQVTQQIAITIGTIIQRADTVSAQTELQWSDIRLPNSTNLGQFVIEQYGEFADAAYPLILARSGIRNPNWVAGGTLIQVPEITSLIP